MARGQSPSTLHASWQHAGWWRLALTSALLAVVPTLKGCFSNAAEDAGDAAEDAGAAAGDAAGDVADWVSGAAEDAADAAKEAWEEVDNWVGCSPLEVAQAIQCFRKAGLKVFTARALADGVDSCVGLRVVDLCIHESGCCNAGMTVPGGPTFSPKTIIDGAASVFEAASQEVGLEETCDLQCR